MISLIIILVLLAGIGGGTVWQKQRVSTVRKERDV